MRILIIAGPNGAGKTTFSKEFLLTEADCPEFVNADNIAAGLSPFRPESVAWQAGRLMLERINYLSAHRTNFALETTLSTRSYLRQIQQWQTLGYFVELHFLKLPSADWAVRRVAERVRLGGHNIPAPIIHRRFERGWQNFNAHYKQLVDAWTLYDSASMPPSEIKSGLKAAPEALEEPKASYDSKQEPLPQATTGGLAALTRAAEKAVARARAAGLDPVVRYQTKQPTDTHTSTKHSGSEKGVKRLK